MKHVSLKGDKQIYGRCETFFYMKHPHSASAARAAPVHFVGVFLGFDVSVGVH